MSSRQTRKVKKPRMLAYGKVGEYGDIHYPTLPCKDPQRTPKPEENYVSKSMTRDKVRREIQETSAWRRRGFDFALVPEDYCEGEGTLHEGKGKNRKSLLKPRYLLISKYGGPTARDVSKELIEHGHRIIRYLKALVELRRNVQQMNKENFFHNDITDRNITYDESKGKAFLIDFEHADRNPKPLPSSLASNNSFHKIDLNDESYFIDNTINYFLDSLEDAGIIIKGMEESPRSSRPRSSGTRKSKRPHSI
jgi:hypothetical protein